MHGEPADVEAAVLLEPQHRAHQGAVDRDDRPAAAGELVPDRRRRFLQRAGGWIGRAGLRREREPDQVRHGHRVAGGGQTDARGAYPLLSIFAHVSRSPTARLKTRCPGAESRASTQK